MPEQHHSLTPRRILLAEDDDAMRELVGDALRREGHEIVEAWDGADLIRKLVATCERHGAPPDLIISDIRMPWANGLTVLRQMRQHALPVPVILMTAFGDSATHEEAARLGAACLLDKPFDLRDLLAAVAAVFR